MDMKHGVQLVNYRKVKRMFRERDFRYTDPY